MVVAPRRPPQLGHAALGIAAVVLTPCLDLPRPTPINAPDGQASITLPVPETGRRVRAP